MLLQLLVENPNITQRDMAGKLGWKTDTVKYYLNKLKKKGILKRVGTSQNGYWKVISAVTAR